MRCKSMPRTAKKKSKTISLIPTMSHRLAKAADRKPVDGHSPTKFDQAIRDRSLSEDPILSICVLANLPNPHESKTTKQTKICRLNIRATPLLSRLLPSLYLTPLSHQYPPPSKPRVNPPYLPYSSTNDSQWNENKQKKGKSPHLNTTTPPASLTEHRTFPSRNPSSTNISLLNPKPRDPSYPLYRTRRLTEYDLSLPSGPSKANYPLD